MRIWADKLQEVSYRHNYTPTASSSPKHHLSGELWVPKNVTNVTQTLADRCIHIDFRTPVRPSNRTGHLPSPRTTPRSRLDGDEAATLGSDGNWGPQDPRWNTDKQIIKGWGTLEGLIEKYVSDVIVDSIPDIDTTHLVFPYEALHRLSDLAGPIVRHERYAKYIFQLSIWNILSVKFLSHMATEWACEEKGTSQWSQKTKGLAAAMDLLTCEYAILSHCVRCRG